MRARAASLAILTVMAGLVACAPRERPLVVWHAYRGAEETALNAAIDAFRQTSPMPVEVLGVPSETLAAKLTSAIPRGNGPDLFIFAHERIGGWAKAGLLADARPERPEAFLPETRAALTWQGRLRGYPLAFKSLALFLNPDLRARPPETLRGLGAREAGWPPDVFPLGYPAASWYFHAPWLFGAGAGRAHHDTMKLAQNASFSNHAQAVTGETTQNAPLSSPAGLLDASGRFDFGAPAVVASFGEVAALAKANALPKDPSGATVTALFNTGKLAAALSGPWFVGEIAAGQPFSVHPLPPLRDPASGALRPARPFLTVEGAFVSAKARHAELAHALAAHLAGPASAVARAVSGDAGNWVCSAASATRASAQLPWSTNVRTS